MRRLLLCLALLCLALPATAAAHSNPWYTVGLSGEATSTTFDAYTILECWQVGVIAPGQTKYFAARDGVEAGQSAGGSDSYLYGSRKWQLSEIFDLYRDWHPLSAMDIDTGYATRYFQGYGGPGVTGAKLGTRRLSVEDSRVFNLSSQFVKFVHQGGSRPIAVRPWC